MKIPQKNIPNEPPNEPKPMSPQVIQKRLMQKAQEPKIHCPETAQGAYPMSLQSVPNEPPDEPKPMSPQILQKRLMQKAQEPKTHCPETTQGAYPMSLQNIPNEPPNENKFGKQKVKNNTPETKLNHFF